MNRYCDKTMQALWDDTADARAAAPAEYDFRRQFMLAFPDLASRKEAAYEAEMAAWRDLFREASAALADVLRAAPAVGVANPGVAAVR